MAPPNPFKFNQLENLSLNQPLLDSEQSQQLRALSLPAISDSFETDPNVIDADTLSDATGDKLMRLSGIDAWESFTRGKEDDPRILEQIDYLSKILGKNPDEVDAADVKTIGLMMKGKTAELAKGGLYFQETGQDNWGRSIVKAYTPDGREVSEVLNNPAFNVDYFKTYNKGFRMKQAMLDKQKPSPYEGATASGFDKDGRPETQFDPTTGKYVFGGQEFDTVEQVEKLAPAVSAKLNAQKAWNGPIGSKAAVGVSAFTSLYGTLVEDNIFALEHGTAVSYGEKVKQYNTALTEPDKDQRITDDEYHQYQDLKKIDKRDWSKEDQAFMESDRGQILMSLDQEFMDKQLAWKQQKLKQADRASIVNRIGETGREINFDSIVENDGFGAGLAYMLKPESLLGSGRQMIESLPFMALLAAPPIVSIPGMAAMYTSSVVNNKEQFAAEYKRAPTQEEMGAIRFGSAVMTLGEKFGADYLFKGFPGGRVAIRKVLAGYPWLLSKPVGLAGATVETIIAEGSSGAITEAGEQVAIGKYDPTAIAYGGIVEATGALGMRGAVTSAQTAVRLDAKRKQGLSDEGFADLSQRAQDIDEQLDNPLVPEEEKVNFQKQKEALASQLIELRDEIAQKAEGPKAPKEAQDMLNKVSLLLADKFPDVYDPFQAYKGAAQQAWQLNKSGATGAEISTAAAASLSNLARFESMVSIQKKKLAEMDESDPKYAEQKARVEGYREQFDLRDTINEKLSGLIDEFGEAYESSVEFDKLTSMKLDTPGVPKADPSKLSEGGKKVLQLKKELDAIERQITDPKTTNKVQQQVHDEVLHGDSKGLFTGLSQYLGFALNNEWTPERTASLNAFAQNQIQKVASMRKAFNDAVANKKTYYVNKSNPAEIVETVDKAEKNNYWAIHSKSKKLVDGVARDSEYIAKAKELIDAVVSEKENVQRMGLEDIDVQRTVSSLKARLGEYKRQKGSVEDIGKPVEKKSSEGGKKETPPAKAQAEAKAEPKPEPEPKAKKETKEPEAAEAAEVETAEAAPEVKSAKTRRAKINELRSEQKSLRAEQLRLQNNLDDAGLVRSNEVLVRLAEIQNQLEDLLPKKVEPSKVPHILKPFADRLLPLIKKTKAGKSVQSKFNKEYNNALDLVKFHPAKMESIFSLMGENAELTRAQVEFFAEELFGDQYSAKNRKQVETIGWLYEKVKGALATHPEILPLLNDLQKEDGTPSQFPAANAGLFYLVPDGKGKRVAIPDKLAFSMTLGLLDWIATNADESVDMSPSLVAGLLRDGEDTKAGVPGRVMKVMRQFGKLSSQVESQIGHHILSTQGIALGDNKETLDFNDTFTNDSLASSLGSLAVLVGTKINVAKGVPLLKYQQQRPNISWATNSKFNPSLRNNKKVTWSTVQVPSRAVKGKGGKRYVPHQRITDLKEVFTNPYKKNQTKEDSYISWTKLANKLTGQDTVGTGGYELDKIKKVNKHSRNNFYQHPEDVVRGILRAQSKPLVRMEETYSVFTDLTDDTTLVLLNLKDPEKVALYNREGVEAANAGKLQDWKYFQEYNSDTGGAPIYIPFAGQKNNRVFSPSTNINPARSKMHRFLFQVGDKTYEITNAQELADFKAAIGQGFDKNVDRQSMDKVETDFKEIYEASKPVLKLINKKNRTSADKAELNKGILELHDTYSGGYHLLNALIALAKYDEALRANKGKEKGIRFQNLALYEVDARTSGYALGLTQFFGSMTDAGAGNLQSALRRVGVLLKGDEGTVDGYLDKQTSLDSYEEVGVTAVVGIDGGVAKSGKKWKTILEEMMGQEFVDDKGKPTSFLRNLIKNPFMIFNYGAGLYKISTAIAQETLEKTLDNLASKQFDYNSATNEADQKKAVDEAVVILEHLRVISGQNMQPYTADRVGKMLAEGKADMANKGLHNHEINYGTERKIVETLQKEVYKKPIQTSMEAIAGAGLARRKMQLEAIGYGSVVMEALFRQEILALRAENATVDKAEGEAAAEQVIDPDTPVIPAPAEAPTQTPDGRFVFSKAEQQEAIKRLTAKATVFGINTPFGSNPESVLSFINTEKADFGGKAVQTKTAKHTITSNELLEDGRTSTVNPGTTTKSSIESAGDLRVMVPPGASPLVIGIQNLDAWIMNQAVLSGADFYNLYDAVLGNSNEVAEIVQKMNDNFNSLFDQYSLFEEVNNMLNNLASHITPELGTLIRQAAEDNIQHFPSVKKMTKAEFGEAFPGLLNESLDIVNSELAAVKKDQKETSGLIDRTKSKNYFLHDRIDQEIDQLTSVDFGSVNQERTVIFNDNSLAGSVLDIARQLRSLDNSDPEHNEYLNSLYGEGGLLTALQLFDGIEVEIGEVQGESYGFATLVEDAQGKLQVSRIESNYTTGQRATAAGMSGFEAYTHELIHVPMMIALREDSKFREKTKQAYSFIKNQMTWRDFLARDSQGNILIRESLEQEEAIAKQKYATVFAADTSRVTDKHLQEFIAYALTHKQMVSYLKGYKATQMSKSAEQKDASPFLKVLALFQEAIDIIKRALKGKKTLTPKDSIYDTLFAAAQETVALNINQRTKIRDNLIASEARYIVTNIDDKASGWAREMLRKAGEKMAIKGYIDGKPLQRERKNVFDTVIIAAGWTLYDGWSYITKHPTWIKNLGKSMDTIYNLDIVPERLKDDERMVNFLGKVRKGIRYTLEIPKHPFLVYDETMLRLKDKAMKIIDVGRKRTEGIYSEMARLAFSEEEDLLTPEVESSITRVFVKSDLASLLDAGYTPAQILELVADSAGVIKELNSLAQELGVSRSKWLTIQLTEMAKRMVTHSQNGHGIHKNIAAMLLAAPTKVKQMNLDAKKLDAYVSLLALQQTDANYKGHLLPLIDRARSREYTRSGLIGTLTMLKQMKEEVQQESFQGNPIHMQKGYAPRILNGYTNVKVATLDKQSNLEKEGYQKIAPLRPIDGLPGNKYYIFVNNNYDQQPRTSGALSVTNQEKMGTSLRDLYLLETDGDINLANDLLKKAIEREQAKGDRAAVSKGHPPSIVINDKGEIVDLTLELPDAYFEEYLNQDLNFFKVFGRIWMQSYDRSQTEGLNREIIGYLDKRQEGRKKWPHRYVDILSDDFKSEYFYILPKETRKNIIARARSKSQGSPKLHFWVERKHLDLAFGYKNPSISNLFSEDGRYFPTGQRVSRQIEAIARDTMNLVRKNIVMRIPTFMTENLISNAVTSMLWGVPMKDIVRHWRDGLYFLEDYTKDARKLAKIEARIKTDPKFKEKSAVQEGRQRLIYKLKQNPVHQMMDAGMYSIITEDVDTEIAEYRSKKIDETMSKVEGVLNKDKRLKTAAEWAFLAENTRYFQEAQHVIRTSDFIGRFALDRHFRSQGMSESDIYRRIQEVFVNYNVPLPRYLSWLDGTGLVRFAKYNMNIQRAIVELVKDRPVSVGTYYLLGYMGVPLPKTIINSSMLLGKFPQTLEFYDSATEVFIPPGLEVPVNLYDMVTP